MFKVWDELNGDEEEAHAIEALDPEFAAEKYAEQDYDGHADGLYQTPHPISVRDPSGELHRFEVAGEVSIDYCAYSRKP